MAPSTSKKVKKLDHILESTVRRSRRCEAAGVSRPSNRRKVKKPTRSEPSATAPAHSPPAPIAVPDNSPPREVPICDDDGQIPEGEVEYFPPDPNRRFGQGPPLNATFGKLKCFYGNHPRTTRSRKKQSGTYLASNPLDTQLEPVQGLEDDSAPREPVPHTGAPEEGASRADASPPAMREHDEPEAPLLSSVGCDELEAAARCSQSPTLTPQDDLGNNVGSTSTTVAKKSIRKKSSSLAPTEGQPPVKKKRGIVNNHKLSQELERLGADKRIRVEVGPDGKNPASCRVKSLLAHAVGSYVKSVLPMNVTSSSKYPDEVWKKMLLHLGCSFEINGQPWLKTLILKMAADRFREWKSKCNSFYIANPDKIPDEFTDRRDEWDWLVNHFKDPAFQAKSSKMRALRESENRRVHHSGKMSFFYRAERYLKNGHKAAHLAAFQEVYAADPNAGDLAVKMKERVAEITAGETDLDALADPIPEQAQLDIIDEILDRRKVRSTQALPKKVQAFLDVHEELERTKEELRKKDEEAAKKQEDSMALIQSLAERIKALEEKNGNAAGSDRASDK